MNLLAIIIAKLLDPVSVIITVIVVLFSRSAWIVPVAAIVAALSVESMLVSTQFSRNFGDGIVLGLVASMIHATIAFKIVNKIRKGKVSK